MNNAFARSKAIFSLIAAAMMSGNVAASMAAIPEYKSRDHGRGKPFQKTNWHRSNSKYTPHQGKQEIARRAAQIAAGKRQFDARA